MKRCPRCNHVETDHALTFCRADGTPLIRESGTVSEGAGTLKFSSPPVLPPVLNETTTRILPQAGAGAATDDGLSKSTAPTTVLDAQRASGGTRELGETKPHKVIVIASAAIIAVAIAAASYRYLSRGKSAAGKNSIAVLPFVNASSNADVEYLSDGITESLINSLSQLPTVRVLARSTMFRFKGEESDPQAVSNSWALKQY